MRFRRAAAVLAVVVAGGVAGASTTAVIATAPPSPGPYGWGNNRSGEVGDGTTAPRNSPVRMVGLANVATLAVGAVHGLALETDGSVLAWGHNRSGQLGNGSFVDSSTPVRVTGIGPVKALVAGDAFSVAVQTDGSVFAWGNNNSGELGNGTTTKSATPVHVSGLGSGSGVVSVSAGESHALALKADGTVLAWGNNNSGELGNGTTNKSSTPVQVSGLGPGSGVVRIAAGGSFSLALKSDGTVLAWGNNQSGEVGDGTTTDRHTPVRVAGLGPGSGVVKLAAGLTFVLALKYGGTLLSWGHNARGELGNGQQGTDRGTPGPVTGGTGVVDIAAGWEHGLALHADGSIDSWGDNSLGQLGDGTTNNRASPVPVQGFGAGSNVAAVFAAGDQSHAIVSISAPTPPTPPVPPSGAVNNPNNSGGSGRTSMPTAPTAHPVAQNPHTAG